MVFFTSDLHLGHCNIIRLCNRPFSSVDEMDERLIEKWNEKVTNTDTVYILGDLMFRNEKPPEEYLRQLRGKKHLIIGNHDREWIKKCDLSSWFESTNNLLYTTDGKHQLTLCHYPMMSWPHMVRCYMAHGHIHANTDAEYWPLIQKNPLMLNAGVDINNFEPVTFDEMVENNTRHKRKISADKYLELDGLSYGLSVQVVIGLDAIWQIDFKKQQPIVAKDEIEILKRITNVSGATIPAPHSLRNMIAGMNCYPQICQWMRKSIKNGTINEQSYRRLQEAYRSMNTKRKGAAL